MKASVVIPAFNEEKFIARCLESIKKQDTGGLEIIVADDGSTDKTVMLARQYADQVLILDHKGCGAARNAGARAAKADILVFIDADMYLAPDCIRKLLIPIEEGRETGTFVVDERVANPDNKWSQLWSIAHNLPFDKRLNPATADYTDAFRAVRKDVFLRFGGYYEDREVGEDKIGGKLGVMAFAVRDAVIYHNNPDTLDRVKKDAMKFGRGQADMLKGTEIIGMLLKYSILRSVPVGIARAISSKRPAFLGFKIMLDLFITAGFIQGMIKRGKSAPPNAR